MPLRTLLGTATAATAALLLGPATLAAQDTPAAPAATPPVVRGRVIDARTQAAVPDAVVALTAGRDTLGTARTDGDGFFAATLRASAAALVAHFARAGYRGDSLALDTAATAASTAASAAPLAVAMTPAAASVVASADGPAAVTLRPARIVASAASQIAERARRAGGTYIGAAEIARRAPGRTADLFRGVSGVVVQDDGGRTRLASTRRVEMRQAGLAPAAAADSVDPLEGVKLPGGGGTSCVLRVGLDGQLMAEDFSVDDVPVSDVAAIEIYRGAATVPVALSTVRGSVKCGAIMIWTRGKLHAR